MAFTGTHLVNCVAEADEYVCKLTGFSYSEWNHITIQQFYYGLPFLDKSHGNSYPKFYNVHLLYAVPEPQV